MKRLGILAVVLMAAASTVLAQTTSQDVSQSRYRWNGYLGFGPSFISRNTSRVGGTFGFGAEVLIKQGFGVGGEIAMIGEGGGAFGMASLNAAYHFVKDPYRRKGLVPFITGGVTGGSGGDGVNDNGGNIGGGVSWWFRERSGVRVEVRDYMFGGNTNYVGLRLGISFR